ncbi:efflux RND transporter periplasmic adaptor subunit [Hugenholtzia roseola]|uniref:efflux RND transporter periplasmic adaptor subunit n=1 Tax=Hugenholtzia roseola TaxID=1002 RepID=UPI0013766432|nr:efflux RND transporter periplasmic adaptor subunit [Hugenholtzia roseola]
MKNTSSFHFPYLLVALFSSLLLLLGSCADSETTTEGQNQANPTQNKTTEEAAALLLTEEQVATLGIKLGKLTTQKVNQEIRATGTLHLPPQNRAFVSAQVAGKITQIPVHEGDRVQKGQVLAYLSEPSLLLLQRDFLTKKEDLELKRSELERQKTLKEGNATAEKNYQQAQAAYQTALAEYEALKAQLQVLNLNPNTLTAQTIQSQVPIIAPLSGSLYQIKANLGEFVGQERVLFEILNQEHLHLEILVYEKDLSHLKVGQTVHFTPANQTLAPDEALPQAKIYAIAESVEPASKTVRVHAEIPKTQFRHFKLLAGMYAQVHIQTVEAQAEVLPQAAILTEKIEEKGSLQVQSFVYVLKQKTKEGYEFEKVPLLMQGETDGWALVENLPPTWREKMQTQEIVVVQGAFYLQSAATKEE